MQFIPIVERSTTELLEIASAGWGDHNRRRPVYTQHGGLVTERTVRPEAWGAFLTGILDEWVTHDVGNVFIQLFELALASWLGMPASLCVFAETCGNALALEHNGDLYSCDHFVEARFRWEILRRRLQWRVPAQSLYPGTGRRGGLELSVRRIQGLLPAHRSSP